MRTTIESVLELQHLWTGSNTTHMQARGVLIRSGGPQRLRTWMPDFVAVMPAEIDDLRAEGKDGMGPKSEIPWFRLFSLSRSPRARFGWYLVYLFDGTGEAAYLSLNQGTTLWQGGAFLPLPVDVLKDRVARARELLGDMLAATNYLLNIDLKAKRTDLGHGYELGNVAAIRYEAKAVPSDEILKADVIEMLPLLGKLYESFDSAELPGDQSAELTQAESIVADLAGRPPVKGSGFRRSAEERRAIEKQAMKVVRAFFRKDDWDVRNVSGTQPVDLIVSKGSTEIRVEVKGTTTAGIAVLLTRGEVEHTDTHHPATALAVVRHIVLGGTKTQPVASGGELELHYPWSIDASALTPIAYRYQVPIPVRSSAHVLDFVFPDAGVAVEPD